jgi:ribA/ribD-fused uncharacterized protein
MLRIELKSLAGRGAMAWLIAVTGCSSSPPPPTPASKPASQPAVVRAKPTTVPTKIDSFEGEYRFLSNFWPAKVVFEGLSYPSVEHAYQSAKTLDMDDRKHIAAIPDAADAKRLGRELKLRPDWEQVKLGVMETCVRYKFSHNPEMRTKLLATGELYLEEGNTWNDRYWGVCEGQGENHLGKILMKVRAELRSSPRGLNTP